MSWPDILNGTFEAIGGLFILNHCRVLLKDKKVAGVSILSTVFFFAWGVWNLYYYPHLGQMLSFLGGAFLVLANLFWIILLVRYRNA